MRRLVELAWLEPGGLVVLGILPAFGESLCEPVPFCRLEYLAVNQGTSRRPGKKFARLRLYTVTGFAEVFCSAGYDLPVE
jgi:hypothetical protein